MFKELYVLAKRELGLFIVNYKMITQTHLVWGKIQGHIFDVREMVPRDHLLLESAPNLGPLIYLVRKLTSSKIADTKVSGF
jgi:hypothetical protein